MRWSQISGTCVPAMALFARGETWELSKSLVAASKTLLVGSKTLDARSKTPIADSKRAVLA